MPRVVSGIARGMNLESIKGLATRPTADKVKEAVFSSIAARVTGSRFLDLFAGTGQIGIEALSRGAEHAFFIDQSRDSIQCINRNLNKTHLLENATVIQSNVRTGILRLSGLGPFDIVYMDPPYDEAISSFRSLGTLLLQECALAPDALLLLEHRAADTPDAFVMNLKLKRSCKYGTIMVSFYGMV